VDRNDRQWTGAHIVSRPGDTEMHVRPRPAPGDGEATVNLEIRRQAAGRSPGST